MKKKQAIHLNKKAKNIITIISIILLLILALIINHTVMNYTIKALIYTIGISFILIFLTKKYKDIIINTTQEIKNEIKTITWPTKKETIQSSLSILAIIACTSMILWILDSILTYIISKII